MRAIDEIYECYITESELAGLLNIDTKRIRDLRSHHVNGKQKFIDYIKPTGRCILYPIYAVLLYLTEQSVYSFGINKDENPDLK